MKYAYLLIMSLTVLNLPAQLDLPSWLLPDTLGEYVTVYGYIYDQNDSLPSQGEVLVIKNGPAGGIHQFKSDREGHFEVYLPSNGHYSVKILKSGCITKSVDVFTANVPKKAWKNKFALEMEIYMEKQPPGFDMSLSKVPYSLVKYDPEFKFFVYDEEFEKERRLAINKELDRIKMAQIQNVKF